MNTYEYKGQQLTANELMKHAVFGVSIGLIRNRLSKGWTAEKAATLPPLSSAAAAKRAGKARAKQMRARGEKPVQLIGSKS